MEWIEVLKNVSVLAGTAAFLFGCSALKRSMKRYVYR